MECQKKESRVLSAKKKDRVEKKRLGLIFGGESLEHEVSVQSAKEIIGHLDVNKYSLIPIGIDKRGEWHFFKQAPFLSALKQGQVPTFKNEDTCFPPLFRGHLFKNKGFCPSFFKSHCDLVFPIVHGPFGEDGTIQGLLELANIPYVGSDLLSSSMCMDKGIMKDILRSQGLPTSDYLVCDFKDRIDAGKIMATLGLPLFVKPARMGSSIGVSKISQLSELLPAIDRAFQFDEKVVIETCIEGREIECSVLGNEEPQASLPGEIIPTHSFYSYSAKYIDQNGAHFVVPAHLDPQTIVEIQRLAIQAFQALCCEGMARVDFFLKKDGTLLINELNTIPGFTPLSLYPRLWEVSGLAYTDLLDRLVELAIRRHQRKKRIRTQKPVA